MRLSNKFKKCQYLFESWIDIYFSAEPETRTDPRWWQQLLWVSVLLVQWFRQVLLYVPSQQQLSLALLVSEQSKLADIFSNLIHRCWIITKLNKYLPVNIFSNFLNKTLNAHIFSDFISPLQGLKYVKTCFKRPFQTEIRDNQIKNFIKKIYSLTAAKFERLF